MPGKVFVQMYSNLEWEIDLAEEQSMEKDKCWGKRKENDKEAR